MNKRILKFVFKSLLLFLAYSSTAFAGDDDITILYRADNRAMEVAFEEGLTSWGEVASITGHVLYGPKLINSAFLSGSDTFAAVDAIRETLKFGMLLAPGDEPVSLNVYKYRVPPKTISISGTMQKNYPINFDRFKPLFDKYGSKYGEVLTYRQIEPRYIEGAYVYSKTESGMESPKFVPNPKFRPNDIRTYLINESAMTIPDHLNIERITSTISGRYEPTNEQFLEESEVILDQMERTDPNRLNLRETSCTSCCLIQ